MAAKAPIYREDLKGSIIDRDLLNQLRRATEELEGNMRASKPIFKGNKKIGYGVDKVQRGIAADLVISIAKAIKALRGW